MAKALLQLLSVVGLAAATPAAAIPALISAVITLLQLVGRVGDSALRIAAQEQ